MPMGFLGGLPGLFSLWYASLTTLSISSKFSSDRMIHENSGFSILHPEYSKSNKLKHKYVNFNNLATSWRARNRLAKDYNMPELKQICLYDFKRFKGTRTYRLTHSTIQVMEELGQKDSRSVLRYITLEANITWLPIICHNQTEIEQAIIDDCILVCQAEGITYFKKPA
jgi:hypothetical protein